MDAKVGNETVLERRMAMLHVLLEEGIEPAALVPLFELLATEAAVVLGPEHELTLEADLAVQLCDAAPRDVQPTAVEWAAHEAVLRSLGEALRLRCSPGDPVLAEVDLALAQFASTRAVVA